MNRTLRIYFSRTFKPPRPAADDIDDIPAWEKSFRSSSFALLPSAVTPSRVPSNTLIASCRAPFFKAHVRFHIPYGSEKWPDLVDWYNSHGSRGFSAIDKIQLRKNRQHPYYHEYIVIITRGGYTFRIDRRPDADAAFDTIMREGCTPYDTIEEVDSTSLEVLNGVSECVVELHWRGEQTVNLLFILFICFRIRNDKWTKRYTLQHYNCYFLSWTIIMIIVRNSTVVSKAEAFKRGVQSIKQALKAEWTQECTERERTLILGLEAEQEAELELERMQVGVDVLEQARARVDDMKLELRLERRRKQEQAVRALVPVLVQVPLVLGWQLAQGWKNENANVREKLREVLGGADTESLPAQEWRKSLGAVVIQTMEEAKADICGTLSDLADFPTSFSVSLNNNVSCYLKAAF